MTPELLTSIFAVLLSLLASYLPGFSTWYEGLSSELKRLAMAFGLLLIASTIAGLACAGYGEQIGVTLPCDIQGFWTTLKALMAALAVNQATYQLTKPSFSARVALLKAARSAAAKPK